MSAFSELRTLTALYKQIESDACIVGGSTRNWCFICNASSSALAFNQIPLDCMAFLNTKVNEACEN